MTKLTVLLLVLFMWSGCAPWYAKFGIKSEKELKSRSSVPKLARAMSSMSYGYYALPALAELGEDALPALKVGLDNPDPNLRARTMKAIADLGSREAVAVLLPILASANVDDRRAAASAIDRAGLATPEVLTALQHSAANDPDAKSRKEAKRAHWSLKVKMLAAGKQIGKTSGKNESKPPVTNFDRKTAGDGKTVGEVMAVFGVEDLSGRYDRKTLDQLTEYLSVRISERGRYRVVPGDQLRARLSTEKRKGYRSCYEQSCQIELGKAVAAEKILTTRLIRVGKRCALTATVFDLRSETTDKAASADTDCSLDALLGGARRVIEKL